MKPQQALNLILAVLFAATVDAQSLHLERAREACTVGNDYVFCYFPAFRVDAYGGIDQAEAAFNALPEAQRERGYLVTTNDQTRRALVIFPWDYSKGLPPDQGTGDQYTALLFPVAANADDHMKRMTPDQRASSLRLRVGRDVLGGGVLLVYRTFGG